MDAAAFYNDYDQIITTIPGTPFPETRTFPPYLVVPLELQNAAAGYNHGFELAADWRLTQAWRLQLAYSYLHQDIESSQDVPLNAGNLNQISLFSSWNIQDNLDLDAWWRYVHRDGTIRTLSPSGNVAIDPYSTLTLRLGWRPRKDLDLSLVGANLLGGSHLEYVQEAYTFPVEVERSVYGQVKWNFQ